MVAMNIKYDVLENQNCLSSLVKTYLLIVKKGLYLKSGSFLSWESVSG